MEYSTIGPIVAVGMLLLTIGSIIFAAGKLAATIRAETARDVANANLALEKEKGEIQRQINSLALYIRDNYIHKDPMREAMDKHIAATEQMVRRIEDGFVRLEAKVDNMMMDRANERSAYDSK